MAYPFYQPQYQYYYPAQYQQIPQYQQPAIQQAQPAQQSATTPQVSNVWIYSEDEVATYPVAPNNAVRLWSANEPIFYLKCADATGKPSVKVYDIVERTAAPVEKHEAKTDEFAKKADLATVIEAVKDTNGIIASIKADIDTMKGDLYGVAGKRRAAKKSEATDDE